VSVLSKAKREFREDFPDTVLSTKEDSGTGPDTALRVEERRARALRDVREPARRPASFGATAKFEVEAGFHEEADFESTTT